MKDFTFIDRFNTDITPIIAGYEKCAPSHKFGPAVRDYYLVHFCISGKGSFTDRRGTHAVSAGEIFIIKSGEVTVYEADAKDPWEYAWIGFVGNRSEMFLTAPSTARLPSQLGERVKELAMDDVNASEPYISVIYEMMYLLFRSGDESQSSTDRLRRVHRYVRYNYMKELSVAEISATFGFDRSYLYRIFKERYGIGLKEYIVAVRMKNALRLLEEGYSVSETATMVGYLDPFNFSKAFKAYYGASPSKYCR